MQTIREILENSWVNPNKIDDLTTKLEAVHNTMAKHSLEEPKPSSIDLAVEIMQEQDVIKKRQLIAKKISLDLE